MTKRIGAALVCMALSWFTTTNQVQAAVVTWQIVSSASSVSLAIPNQVITLTSPTNFLETLVGTSFTMTVRALNPGSGSTSTPSGWTVGNKQSVNGSFQTSTDFTSFISFLDSSVSIGGVDSGSYQPLPDGSAGTAPSDFGTRLYVAASPLFGGVNIDVAIRDALYSIGSSSSLAINGSGQFSTNSGFQTGFDSASLAFRLRDGFGFFGSPLLAAVGSGTTSLESLVNNNAATPGTIAGDPSAGVLTIPISVPLLIPLDPDGFITFKANLTGQIYAVAMPEPGTWALLAIGAALLAPAALRRRKARGRINTGQASL